MKSIISIISGKGGAGKSTCAIGIAAALCKLDKSVLLIDLDAGLRCLDIMLGMDERLVFDLSDVLSGKPLESALLKSERYPGLSLLAAPHDCCNIDGDALARFLLGCQGYDYIILDFPAGLDFPYLASVSDISDFLVVTAADKLGMRDSFATVNRLQECGCNCRLIINKYERQHVKKGLYGGIDDVIDSAGCRLIGIIPFDKKIVKRPVTNKRSLTARAFARIAKRIYGYEIPLPRIKKIEKGK